MALISQLAAIVLPIFLCAGIGLFWARSGRDFDSALVSTLVYKISVPSLIVATFSKVELTAETLGTLGLAAILVNLGAGIAGAIVLRIAKLPFPSYLPAMTFSLVGSMGLPVCLFAFGEEGLAFGLAFFTITSIGTFTVGVAIAAGRMSLDMLIKEPSIWAAAIALLLLGTGWKLPEWAINTTWLLGGIAIPLQLIALGVSIGQFRVTSLGRGAVLAALKIAIGFGLGLGLAEWLEIEGVARSVLILMAMMPVAVSNYMFALIYKREPVEVAAMVLISTAMSAVTLPLVLAWLLTGG